MSKRTIIGISTEVRYRERGWGEGWIICGIGIRLDSNGYRGALGQEDQIGKVKKEGVKKGVGGVTSLLVGGNYW